MTFKKTNSILGVRQCQEGLLQNNALKLNIFKVIDLGLPAITR